ncbi:hypothetical protein NBRC116188_26430 [Oceaniserpentilla sp. 4NH20-0058]|uniref:hypothetical protein n=1 Tax=Oceaniserpentilla sp. 4NH20-0058 TaxID=3127660 RepID=UPI00310B7746
MDKTQLIAQIIQQLTESLSHATAAAEEAHKGATHDQSKAETQYDTLGLEHAYLAEGQAKRIEELQDQISQFHHMKVKSYCEDDPIYLGAVVELLNTQTNQPLCVFLAPCGGGNHIQLGARTIQVVSPMSPLTQALLGLYAEDNCKLASGLSYEILTIH